VGSNKKSAYKRKEKYPLSIHSHLYRDSLSSEPGEVHWLEVGALKKGDTMYWEGDFIQVQQGTQLSVACIHSINTSDKTLAIRWCYLPNELKDLQPKEVAMSNWVQPNFSPEKIKGKCAVLSYRHNVQDTNILGPHTYLCRYYIHREQNKIKETIPLYDSRLQTHTPAARVTFRYLIEVSFNTSI
jgi:hypothetical protein